MVRTQILLEPEQHAFLKARSAQTGEALSTLVREAGDHLRDEVKPMRERALALLGAFKADRVDVSERHDEYFALAGAEVGLHR